MSAFPVIGSGLTTSVLASYDIAALNWVDFESNYPLVYSFSYNTGTSGDVAVILLVQLTLCAVPV